MLTSVAPLPLAGEVGTRSAPGEGGLYSSEFAFGCTTLIRPSSIEAGHLPPPAGEGKYEQSFHAKLKMLKEEFVDDEVD